MSDISLNNEGAAFKSEDFSKKSLENRVFSSCSFHNCNFSESLLRNGRFSSCLFVACNFSLVKWDGCRLQDVLFRECKIVGAEFYKCERPLFSPSFENSFLHYCNFSHLEMKNGKFGGCKLMENNFKEANLSGADFSGADLSGTLFHNCDLSKADFSTATNYNIDLATNKIKKAKFSLPEVIGLLQSFDITIV